MASLKRWKIKGSMNHQTKKIDRMLKDIKHNTPYIMRLAISSVGALTRKELLRLAKLNYINARTAEFGSAFAIKNTELIRPTKSNPKAILKRIEKGRHKTLNLHNFKVGPTKNTVTAEKERRPRFYSAAVKKGATKPLDGTPRAFIAEKNGHLFVAVRNPNRRMRENPKKEGVDFLRSPSIASMLNSTAENHKRELTSFFEKMIEKEVDKRIEKIIAKAARKAATL